MRLPPGRPAQNSDYLAIARKYRFIFLKNQYVKNSIRHLSYKKVFTEPNPEDYPFLVPFYATNPPNQIAPYNPIPNMFIPEKYRDIIPKDPFTLTISSLFQDRVNDREVEEGFKQAAEEKAARWAQEKIIHQELLEKKKEKEI
ncbi:hypothetical protein RhiirA1_474547 [Rhizophagus irregularis]|uniref:DUF8211 domain-containing protein n=1 Tax=Rhizophagus irregularis TaxID=588596 RepID=A0A2N0QYF0_9GLOM|nr:hypothetical protein RhiirA1_474547 [Rhizophagus irregularis]